MKQTWIYFITFVCLKRDNSWVAFVANIVLLVLDYPTLWLKNAQTKAFLWFVWVGLCSNGWAWQGMVVWLCPFLKSIQTIKASKLNLPSYYSNFCYLLSSFVLTSLYHSPENIWVCSHVITVKSFHTKKNQVETKKGFVVEHDDLSPGLRAVLPLRDDGAAQSRTILFGHMTHHRPGDPTCSTNPYAVSDDVLWICFACQHFSYKDKNNLRTDEEGVCLSLHVVILFRCLTWWKMFSDVGNLISVLANKFHFVGLCNERLMSEQIHGLT